MRRCLGADDTSDLGGMPIYARCGLDLPLATV
jgi:hypothetical protein